MQDRLEYAERRLEEEIKKRRDVRHTVLARVSGCGEADDGGTRQEGEKLVNRLLFPITRRESEKHGVEYSHDENKNAVFPSQLRKLRNKKGISQETLSKALGVSKSTVGLWETGDTLPDAKHVYELSKYYGVSADYLVGNTVVSSTDTDLRTICEYTGLSEEAIQVLSKGRDSGSPLATFINTFAPDAGHGSSNAIIQELAIRILKEATKIWEVNIQNENEDS